MQQKISLNTLLGTAAIAVLIALGLGKLGRSQASPTSAGSTAPELIGRPGDFLNTDGKALRLYGPGGLLKKPSLVLVDFWEYTCVNCLRTLPYLKEWNRRYAADGLVIVGIHTPEFDFAKSHANVAAAAKRLGVTYPVLIDSTADNWRAFGNQVWPHEYLIGPDGVVVHEVIGEGQYGETETLIQKLLRRLHPNAKPFPPVMAAVRPEDRVGAVCYPTTAETYVGYGRGQIGNLGGYRPDVAATYVDRGGHEDGIVCAQGRWTATPEALRHARRTATPVDYIDLRYHALEANAVIRPETGQPFAVIVTQDGHPVAAGDRGADLRTAHNGDTYLWVDAPRMYQVIHNQRFGWHELKLSSTSDGFGLYSYTFTSCEAPGGG